MPGRVFYFVKYPLGLIDALVSRIPYFGFIRETADYQNRVGFWFWFRQKVLNIGGNKQCYWPVHYTSTVFDADRIRVGVDAYPGIMKGCYIMGLGGIEIGDFTQVGPNVVIVSANHDKYDSRKNILKPIKIGAYCWLGAGVKIMPGVELGDWTVVAAGAVVTKSFPNGYATLAGVPAKPIETLKKELCDRFGVRKRYHGYLSEAAFKKRWESNSGGR